MDVSYLSDALGDLARACRGILRGLPEAAFSFQQEPGEHRFVVTRYGQRVHVVVDRYDDTFSRSKPAERVLPLECSLSELATAAINCLRHILDEHGEAGYAERWRQHAFPMQE